VPLRQREKVQKVPRCVVPTALLAASAIAALGADNAAGLPDPALTPGVAMRVPLATLCAKGYANSVRHVSGKTKAAVYAEYGIPKARRRDYEVDHLIPLELGGTNDIKNLWAQPYSGEWNAHVKDALEDRLHETICRAGPSISLAEAQQALRADWIAAYKRVFNTDAPLRRANAPLR